MFFHNNPGFEGIFIYLEKRFPIRFKKLSL